MNFQRILLWPFAVPEREDTEDCRGRKVIFDVRSFRTADALLKDVGICMRIVD